MKSVTHREWGLALVGGVHQMRQQERDMTLPRELIFLLQGSSVYWPPENQRKPRGVVFLHPPLIQLCHAKSTRQTKQQNVEIQFCHNKLLGRPLFEIQWLTRIAAELNVSMRQFAWKLFWSFVLWCSNDHLRKELVVDNASYVDVAANKL